MLWEGNENPYLLLMQPWLQVKLLERQSSQHLRELPEGYKRRKLCVRQAGVTELILQTNGLAFCQLPGIARCLGNAAITMVTTEDGAADRPVPIACIPRPAVPYAPTLFMAYLRVPPLVLRGSFQLGDTIRGDAVRFQDS